MCFDESRIVEFAYDTFNGIHTVKAIAYPPGSWVARSAAACITALLAVLVLLTHLLQSYGNSPGMEWL